MSFRVLCQLFTVTTLCALTFQTDPSSDYYTAAVVEYAPESNPTLDSAKNIFNNLNNYLNFIRKANLQKADIIVFPETGLIGNGNQIFYSEVPDGKESITPCGHSSSLALVQLSCAARTYSIYVVVNLPEIYNNSSTGETKHFNTDVVFDRNGTIIARYRKYNLFGEVSNNIPELEHIYFHTDFGVTFGVFTCFDIDFNHPAVSLVRDYNVRHFVFPLSWISELPFLTAIQTQWAWAYSNDVVLLASGYNGPSHGSSGSGIYQGRHGPLVYNMTDTRGSKMLLANVSKNNYTVSNALTNEDNEVITKTADRLSSFTKLGTNESTTSRLYMLQDFINLFKTEILLPPKNSTTFTEYKVEENNDNNTEVTTSLEVSTTICQRTLCCDFNINMTTTSRQGAGNSSNRGDDYNRYYYRLAVFDGVRTYSGFATGGVQLCSVISCVDDTPESCGLRADHVTAKPVIFENDIFGNMTQTKVVFNNVQIGGYFANNNSLVFPDVFVSGSGDSFGALVGNSEFEYQTSPPSNDTVHCELKSLKALSNLITFGVYSRQFGRDGQAVSPSEIPLSTASTINTSLLLPCLLLIITTSTCLCEF